MFLDYVTLLIVFLGTLGNLLSIAVFLCKELRRFSSTPYLTTLAISDIGSLLFVLAICLQKMGVPTYDRPFLCRFLNYLYYVCFFLSTLLIVAFTIERFVVTNYPHRRAIVCMVARAMTIVLILVGVATVSCSPYIFLLRLKDQNAPNDNKEVTYYCTFDWDYVKANEILHILKAVFVFVLPIILIAVLNLMIARTIWKPKSGMTFDEGTSGAPIEDVRNENLSEIVGAARLNATDEDTPSAVNGGRSRRDHELQITKMLLVISSIFVVLNVPFCIVVWITFAVGKDGFDHYWEVLKWCHFVYRINFAIKFWLYCLCGQNFRKALKSLFWKVARKIKCS